MSHLFTTGSHVSVAPVAKKGKPNSEGGAAYIVGINKNDDGDRIQSFDVQYVLQKKVSREVQPSRIAVQRIDTDSRRRINNNKMPSLLSTSYSTAKRVAESVGVDDQPAKPKRRKGPKLTEDMLLMSPEEAYKHLCSRNNNSPFGWLRLAENGVPSTTPLSSLNTKQLTTADKDKVLALRRLFNGVIKQKSNHVTCKICLF